MARFIPDFPETFSFTAPLSVRITDINYGGHVGNDKILSLIHEARVLYLQHHGLTELKFGPASLIMKNVTIDFIKELFYGEELTVGIQAAGFSKVSFNLFYKLEKAKDTGSILVAQAKTGMVCFDYSSRKVSQLTDELREKLI